MVCQCMATLIFERAPVTNFSPDQFLPSCYSEQMRWGRGSPCKLEKEVVFGMYWLNMLFSLLLNI